MDASLQFKTVNFPVDSSFFNYLSLLLETNS